MADWTSGATGAIGGASAGSAFGPIGAGVGAVVGGVAGLFMTYLLTTKMSDFLYIVSALLLSIYFLLVFVYLTFIRKWKGETHFKK